MNLDTWLDTSRSIEFRENIIVFFLFSARNDLACLGIRALGFQNIKKKKKKTYFMAIIIDIESHTHTKSCCDL